MVMAMHKADTEVTHQFLVKVKVNPRDPDFKGVTLIQSRLTDAPQYMDGVLQVTTAYSGILETDDTD